MVATALIFLRRRDTQTPGLSAHSFVSFRFALVDPSFSIVEVSPWHDGPFLDLRCTNQRERISDYVDPALEINPGGEGDRGQSRYRQPPLTLQGEVFPEMHTWMTARTTRQLLTESRFN